MRLVLCAQRLVEQPELRAALVHGLSLGGQQFLLQLERGEHVD
jgi:hypothetical protein